jgi:hypothetical protein
MGDLEPPPHPLALLGIDLALQDPVEEFQVRPVPLRRLREHAGERLAKMSQLQTFQRVGDAFLHRVEPPAHGRPPSTTAA